MGTQLFRPHPDDEADIRAAAEDIAAGRLVRLTSAELEQWVETGDYPELPASAKRRGRGLRKDRRLGLPIHETEAGFDRWMAQEELCQRIRLGVLDALRAPHVTIVISGMVLDVRPDKR